MTLFTCNVIQNFLEIEVNDAVMANEPLGHLMCKAEQLVKKCKHCSVYIYWNWK